MKMKHLLLSLAMMLCSVFAVAQSHAVSGTVRDAAGNPLPGVAVMVPGTTIGTVTDIDGRYTINVTGNPTLSATFIGMQPGEINLAAGQTDVTLQDEENEMDEVIVVAYGVTTKGAYTGSAAQVDAESIEKRQVTDASQALSGVMPGVQILNDNGQPGVSSKIRIRGAGSINGSQDPLIVVDGMPFDGDLATINTADIESMTVLKDAASTSLYGARGANGILMITTKKGRQGDAKITFEARWGGNTRQVGNYDVITSPSEYLELMYQSFKHNYEKKYDEETAHALANYQVSSPDGKIGYTVYTVPDGEDLIGTDGKINPNATLGYSDGEYYYLPDNWEDETFSRQGRQSYDLTISGGTEKVNYFFSASYLNNGGLIPNSDYKRVATRLKVDYQAKKWLKVGANASYSHNRSRYPGEQTTTSSSGNAFFLANNIAPVYPFYVRNADGSIKTTNGRIEYDYGDGSSTNFKRNFMSMSQPYASLMYDKTVYDMDVFNGTVSADITPIHGLTLSAKYGLYVDNTRYGSLGNAYMGQTAQYGGSGTQEHMRTYGLDQQYIGVYQWSIADVNNFDVTVGYDGYHMHEYEMGGYGTHIYNPESYYLGNVTTDFSLIGEEISYATAGYFGRLNYSYDDKYLANVSYRRDSSSRFSEDNRWGDFWSVSAAWLINKENFLSDVKWIDLLKIKGSYGEQGNDNIGSESRGNSKYAYYAYLDQYKVTGSDGTYSDATLVFKGNPDLTWETSKSWNVGVDFAFLRNKIQGSVEYYGRKSSDMLYYKPVASSLGYTEIPMNVGSMTNSGVEIDLNVNVFQVGSFNWDIHANATFNHNKINELHSDLNGYFVDGSRVYEEGESMYRLHIVEYAGVDEKTGEALYWAKDENGNRVTTNDYATAQQYKIDTEDLLAKVYGGFGTSIEFFGFDASVDFAYQLGGKIFDTGYANLMHGGDDAGRNFHVDIRKAWTPTNTKTDVPALDFGDTYANATSTRWLTSSNYLALNNITFGYTVPRSLTSKIYLENVRVYFAADGVALWSKREGLDPRQSWVSASTSRYTTTRTISGGIKITF